MVKSQPPTELPRYALPAILIHDLRSPLNQIIGYSELLIEQAEEVGNVTFVEDLQRVRVAGRQLLALINDSFHSEQEVPQLERLKSFERTAAVETLPHLANVEMLPGDAQPFLLVVDD